MGHIEGPSRDQRELLAPSLDNRIGVDHAVRVIDAFINTLDLRSLGFSNVVAAEMGRPSYDPSDLLKLYVYGYSNQMRSSRRLEKEAGRNIEVQWLIDRVEPSFKTIADFRKLHPDAIVSVVRGFVGFCRSCSLYGGEVVAIDGTKIEAVASRKKVITPKSLAEQGAALDRKIARYLAAMDEASSPSFACCSAGRRDWWPICSRSIGSICRRRNAPNPSDSRSNAIAKFLAMSCYECGGYSCPSTTRGA